MNFHPIIFDPTRVFRPAPTSSVQRLFDRGGLVGDDHARNYVSITMA